VSTYPDVGHVAHESELAEEVRAGGELTTQHLDKG